MYLFKLIVQVFIFMQCRNTYTNGLAIEPLQIESFDKNPDQKHGSRSDMNRTSETTLVNELQQQNNLRQFDNSSLRKTNKDGFVFLVIGGNRTEKNPLAKFVVSLQFVRADDFGFMHFCGGAIISKKVILTAAHCIALEWVAKLLSINKIKVVAGTPRRLLKTEHTQELKLAKIKMHHQHIGFKNDIALLILKDELDINEDFVSIIPIADQKPKTGQKCTVIGWGVILEFGPVPDEIVTTDVNIVPDEYCAKYGRFETNMKLCVAGLKEHGSASCFGDSGGPLICDNKVFGLTSYGKRCAFPTSPSVNTNVYYYREWISRNSEAKDLSFGYKLMLIALMLLTVIGN